MGGSMSRQCLQAQAEPGAPAVRSWGRPPSSACLQVPDLETGPLRPVQQPEQEGDGWLKAHWRRHARNKRIHHELATPEELFWDGIWIQPEEIIQEGILISPHMTEDHYTSKGAEVLASLFRTSLTKASGLQPLRAALEQLLSA